MTSEFNYGLYPVITEAFCKGRSSLEVLKAVAAGGARIVQLREKIGEGASYPTRRAVYELAKEYRKITADNNMILIINDFVDIALAVGADGVHLGQDDLPCAACRKIAPDLLIGVSTHSDEEIRRAEKDGASYINIGPIYATQTKVLGMKPLGLSYLKEARTSLHFSVMGGIKKDKIPELTACGAKNIAMVTEVTMADDIEEQVRTLNNLILQS